MSAGNRKAGEVFIVTRNCYYNVKTKLCKKCNTGFEIGQKVVYVAKDRRYPNSNYSALRHIECYVDAKGNRMID